MIRDFESVVAALSKEGGVTAARMFGSDALKFKTRVFAMVVKGELVVKVSAERAQELLASKHASPFDPGHGRIMRQWVAIGARAKLDWCELAREALAHARG